jgi:phage tail sheath gpL-like
MKKILICTIAAIFAFAPNFSFAAEKSRADVESAIDANKLTQYNAQKMAETLTDLSDSMVNKLSDGIGFFNICGEATTINNNTVYYGPNLTLTANTINGQACDINAAGSTTEATADAPVYTNKAFKVQGMTCRNEGDANANISFTLRTAEGATVPSVTCTIADNERDCVADIGTSTDIAAGATVAIAAASSGNIGDNNGFVCTISTTF